METACQSPRAPDFVQDPYPFYDALRAQGPLVWWDAYDMPCSAHWKVVDAALRDRRFGREAPAAVRAPVPEHLRPFYDNEDNSMIQREPPDHTRLRASVMRAFTGRCVRALVPQMEALCHELIDGFEGQVFDFLTAFAEPLPVRVIARVLGVPEEMGPQLLSWSHDMVAMYQARRDRALEDRAVAATLAFSDFVRAEIAGRRKAPRGDMISMLSAHETLSEDEAVATIILLLNAGHEATVHALGNGVVAALRAGLGPSDFADEAACSRATAEMLRYDPPLHMFTRYALEPFEFFGHSFKVGDEIGLLLAGANRDGAVFDAPDRFDPGRRAAPHVALGAGIHFCVGAPLARAEMDVAMRILFERCPQLSIEAPPVVADRYHFHGFERIMLRA